MPGNKSRLFDQYPNKYPKTDRNCFDCLNLKVTIRLNPKGRILFSKTHYAVCKKNFILRSYHGNNIDIHEPRYAMTGAVWSKIDAGWRHTDWDQAGVCPHFSDMREDHAPDRKKDPISDHLHDSDGYVLSGLMPKMDSPGSALGKAEPGDEVLPQGAGEAIALPEIKAA